MQVHIYIQVKIYLHTYTCTYKSLYNIFGTVEVACYTLNWSDDFGDGRKTDRMLAAAEQETLI